MAKANKPNILFIMSDDIGWFNVSAYNHGIMGYRTPNIDRIAKEGAMFTDFCGQQRCTAGRAAFITGQAPIRTGLTKVGLPGATVGLGAAGDSSLFYDKWMADRAFLLVPAEAIAAKWLESFKQFPIRQKPASFNLDQVVQAAMPHP